MPTTDLKHPSQSPSFSRSNVLTVDTPFLTNGIDTTYTSNENGDVKDDKNDTKKDAADKAEITRNIKNNIKTLQMLKKNDR
jgi:hypothetical protein